MKKSKLKLKDKSTLSKSAYIFYHFIFGICFGIDIFFFLPTFIPTVHIESSYIKLIICLISTSLFGISFSYVNNRKFKGVLIDIFAGLGVYTGITLGKYSLRFIKFLLISTALITFFSLVQILTQKINNKSQMKRVVLARFLRSTQVLRYNFGIAFIIILLAVPTTLHIKGIRDLPKSSSAVHQDEEDIDINDNLPLEVTEVYDDQFKLSENIETIKYIRDDDVFQKLSYDEKKEVVTAILKCEGRYLGLDEFDIVFSNRIGDNTLGSFSYSKRTITINAKPLKDNKLPGGTADEVLNTCLHEARHFYQYLMIELYEQATPKQRNLLAFTGEGVRSWRNNTKDYHSVNSEGESIFWDYAMQPLEIDARQYAYSESCVYYEAIDELLYE